jgi:hypothetical protein
VAAVGEATRSARNGRAFGALLLGVLSTATMPVAIVGTRYSGRYELLHAGFAIPLAIVLGALAIWLARGALRHDDARLGRAGGRRVARLGRALGVLGIALGATGLVALGVYGLLTYLGNR